MEETNKKNSEIPKVIHYCWFGGAELPELAIKCIQSWKEHFPEYEIKEWNESNFDVNCCDYVKEAYIEKKWAFVSDYARFYILYNYGGLYFDTDVEIIKNMDYIIKNGPFMGCEYNYSYGSKNEIFINPGLGLGVNPGLIIYKEVLDFYKTIHFKNANGTLNEHTVVEYTTNIFKQYNFDTTAHIVQKIEGVYIYPPEYFCPLNYETKELSITDNTVSIHHYTASWHSKLEKIIISIERSKNKKGLGYKFKRIISLPFRVVNKISKTFKSRG